MIAKLANGYVMQPGDFDPGLITITKIEPEETGVQILTSYTLVFVTAHNLYAGTNVKIVFPPSIQLPTTG